MGNIVEKYAFLPQHWDPHLVENYKDQLIWLTNKVKKTLLFSHGNAEDVPTIISSMKTFGETLGINVVTYEYSGYSFSRKSSTDHSLPPVGEKYCYANIFATYECLVTQKGVDPHDIIVMGRSLGSGPSTELAVHKPAIRVVMNTPLTLPTDIFANVDKIHKVQCPILIIHGTADQVINISHGKKLFDLIKHENKLCLWIENAGHNDIEILFFKPYIEKIQEFLQMLDKSTTTIQSEKNNTNVEQKDLTFD